MVYSLERFGEKIPIPSYSQKYDLGNNFTVVHVIHLRLEKFRENDSFVIEETTYEIVKTFETRALKTELPKAQSKDLYYSRILIKKNAEQKQTN